MTMTIVTADPAERERGLAAASAALRRGQLVGLPLDTAYGIAVDAFSNSGAAALRQAKGRPDLVIPVMVPRIATVGGIAQVGAQARELMLGFWPGPLTLLLRAQPTLAWSLTDPAGRVAVRMPLHPVALDLLDRTGPLGVVGATTGVTTAPQAFAGGLAEQLAVVLDAGPLPAGEVSAVVDLSGATPILVRPGALDPAALVAACPGLLVPAAPEPDPDP